MKRCPRCGESFLLADFASQSYCRPCMRDYRAERAALPRLTPTEPRRCQKCEADLPLSAFPVNRATRDGLDTTCRPCFVDNVTRYRAEQLVTNAEVQRERFRKCARDRYRRNPAAARAKVRRYQYGLGSAQSFSFGEWELLCLLYGNRCLGCGAEGPLEPDHVVALANGGADLIENIQPLCRSCNASKQARTVDYRPRALAGFLLEVTL